LSVFVFLTTIGKKPTAIGTKTSFDPDLCQNGYAGSWTGACICFDDYHGKYCDKKKTLNSQAKKTDLSSKSINYSSKNQSFQIVLSDEVLSHADAVQFCNSLGKQWTLAYRKNFNCSQTGVNCLDANLFGYIKQQYGHRGFFWLEETVDNQNAYYADLNDGTVYHMNKLNNKTAQALCFFER
jgi:hypothetical protein